jgi:hypothetical protein
MNVDQILMVFNRHGVRYLLIGGMNFLLRHKPVLTFDVDFWIEDTLENLQRCESALAELDAEWGMGDSDWGPVKGKAAGWLAQQGVFCLSCPHGAIDVFRGVKGLGSWQDSYAASVSGETGAGVAYRGLSDEDMLKCQLSLDEVDRKADRISDLKRAVERHE